MARRVGAAFASGKRCEHAAGPLQHIVGRVRMVCRKQMAIFFEVREVPAEKGWLANEDERLVDMNELLPAATRMSWMLTHE